MSDLRDSIGYKSLRHEMRVRAILEKQGWRATHGPYYTDPREGKQRELDVSATQVWTTKREFRAHVILLIECKSKTKSLQLLAEQQNQLVDPLYDHWLGFDDAARDEIRKLAAKAGFEAQRVMARVESLLYPRGRAVVQPLLVNAPKAVCRASGTREAFDADRKDKLPTMFDATEKVFAALHGTMAVERESALNEISDGLFLRQSPADDTVDYAASVVRGAASDVLLFHPIISIDSPLMLVSESGELTDVPWCRVERGRVFGVDRQWIDVVNADAFEIYAAGLTAWYKRVLGRLSAK